MNDISQPNASDIERPRRDKRQKFVELGQKRTINAIKAIRVIGKLGNKAHYEYDESDVRKIVTALNKEVEALKHRLSQTKNHDEIGFSL